MPTIRTRFGLTGNQLKLIAMAAMTLDHIGSHLLPQFPLLRILGRLAMPLYAYMIAEGCRYTHDRMRYFLRIAALALVCQVVYWFAAHSLYQCILVTFSMSVACICTADRAQKQQDLPSALAAAGMLLGAAVACELLPQKIPGFYVDYGFFGVFLPVILYYCRDSLLPMIGGMLLLCLSIGATQWWSLAAIPLMALYNGQRGRLHIGWLFYLYYPLHLVVIYAIRLFL